MRKPEEVGGPGGGRAGADTHVINRRNLNTRYHDTGRYGSFGPSEAPKTDANSSSVSQALFSAPKPEDFEPGAQPLEFTRGQNRKLAGAAGISSSASAEGEPLLRYRAPPDQTQRQRSASEGNQKEFERLHNAPQVEDVTFGGTNVSRLHKPSSRGDLFEGSCGRGRGGASPVRGGGGEGESGSRRPGSPRGARPASPRGAPREAWGSGGGKGAPPRPASTRSSSPRGSGRGGGGSSPAAGSTTHELAQKDQAFGGPGGPDYVPRNVRSGLPAQAKPLQDEVVDVMRYGSSLRRAPDKTAQMRSQQAFVKAAGASTQEVEQQMGSLPFERNKVRGGREATEAQAKADAAARGGGNQSNKGGGGEGTGLQIPGPGLSS